MGIYINPGNGSFNKIRKDRYVDKSGLIAVVNGTIDTNDFLSCISRPRRFGKTFAAAMLAAYYCTGCDSAPIFDSLEISADPSYKEHMNQYNVLYMDITGFAGRDGLENLLSSIRRYLSAELVKEFGEDIRNSETDEPGIDTLLSAAVKKSGKKFIAIIDEWDCPIRDSSSTKELQKKYLEFLRSLFKNANVTNDTFAAAYMTGILPIKKDGSQSAISEFREYTIIEPGPYEPYIGFTEDEVMELCQKYDMDFAEMKRWYDGYSFENIKSIYNPNSVMRAISNRKYRSYWETSAAADSLLSYVSLDYAGLADTVREVMADRPVRVNPRRFKNDTTSFYSKDDVLTLLIHFGYFSYDTESESIRIPNEEIRIEFADTLREMRHPDTIRRIQESDKLIEDIVYKREDEVARAVEKVHKEEFSPLHYNNEQSLRSVIKLAFFAYKDKYSQLEELPGGNGYADIVYIPKKYTDMPILVIELKWDKSAETALDQIRRKDYPAVLKDRNEPIFLVGISYDKDDADKKHSCVIEEL